MNKDILFDVAPGVLIAQEPSTGRFKRISLSSLLGIARQMHKASTWEPPEPGFTTPTRDKVIVKDRVVMVPVPRRIARRMRSHS